MIQHIYKVLAYEFSEQSMGTQRIFQGEKILCMPSFRREVKLWVPCHRFATCKRSLNWRGSCNLRHNYRLILTRIVPPFATGISRVVVDVGTPGGERGNVQTGGGDRVSTISLLGCSTSVALAMGPTDEEEWELRVLSLGVKQPSCEGLLNLTYVQVRNKWSHTSTPVCMTSCCIHGLLPQPMTCCPSNK